MTGRERAVALLAGAAAGLAGGLFGVGGGIVLVPLLTGALRLTQHQAHGTSLAAIGATAVAALAVYGAHGQVAWGTAVLVGLASVATARLGARLATIHNLHYYHRLMAGMRAAIEAHRFADFAAAFHEMQTRGW